MNIPTANELQKIPYHDNGEPLLDLQKTYPRLICEYRRTGSLVSSVLVRKTVAEKLQNIQTRLTKSNPSMQLVIVEGYRHPSYQERYFLQQFLETYNDNTDQNLETIIEKAHQCVALPTVAGHPTGSAVDLTIAYAGKEIDMGCAIADFSNHELMPTFSTKVNKEASNNRKLLHDLMIGEGFAPFYGEWWHFSYGDREWAAFYHHDKTLYAPILGL